MGDPNGSGAPGIAGTIRTMMESVTVVIPSWNGRQHLGECLASLHEYGTPRTSIIVVDNGSTDGSEQFIGSTFPRVTVVRNSANRGFAAACNQGARIATTGYVAFLNNDARVGHSWLEPLLEVLHLQPDVAAVGALVMDWDGRHIDFGRGGMTPMLRGTQLDFGASAREAPDEPTEQLFANGAAMLVRRDTFLGIGGFDERFFAYYEDVDLGWRYWITGSRVLLDPRSRVFHRHHGTSRRLDPAQIEFLLTRNAVATAVKNVDDDTFARLIPLVLLAEAARAIEAGPPSRRFHVEGFEPFSYAPARTSSVETVRRWFGREILRVHGRQTHYRARVAGAVARLIDREVAVVPAREFATLAALHEILWGWPELTARRAEIQRARRRSDQEIARLFGLDAQRTRPRRDRLAPDDRRMAYVTALGAAGLDWLLPRG